MGISDVSIVVSKESGTASSQEFAKELRKSEARFELLKQIN